MCFHVHLTVHTIIPWHVVHHRKPWVWVRKLSLQPKSDERENRWESPVGYRRCMLSFSEIINSNGELSDPLCDSVKRGLTLVRYWKFLISNSQQKFKSFLSCKMIKVARPHAFEKNPRPPNQNSWIRPCKQRWRFFWLIFMFAFNIEITRCHWSYQVSFFFHNSLISVSLLPSLQECMLDQCGMLFVII